MTEHFPHTLDSYITLYTYNCIEVKAIDSGAMVVLLRYVIYHIFHWKLQQIIKILDLSVLL